MELPLQVWCYICNFLPTYADVYHLQLVNKDIYAFIKERYICNKEVKSRELKHLTNTNVTNLCWKEEKELPNDLVQLQILNCYRTPLTILPPFTKLTSLDISNTHITEIPLSLVNLEVLVLNNTKVKEIPSNFLHLRYLCCYNTPVDVIPSTLTDLEKLFCVKSLVTKIPEKVVKLKVLYCSMTLVSEIPKTLVQLEALDIADCRRIRSLPDELVLLRKLNCSNSSITGIPSTFVNLERINTNMALQIPLNLEKVWNYIKTRK